MTLVMSYNSMVVRNGLAYHGHPYLGSSDPVNMSVDTQEPLATQNFSSHGNQPQDTSYNQSDYLLQAQQSFSQTAGFNFFRSFNPQNINSCLGERDANQNNSEKLTLRDFDQIENNQHPPGKSGIQNYTSISPASHPEADLTTTPRPSSHFPSTPLADDSTTHSHSPRSTASLSDSEVPDRHTAPLVTQPTALQDPELSGKEPNSESCHPGKKSTSLQQHCSEEKGESVKKTVEQATPVKQEKEQVGSSSTGGEEGQTRAANSLSPTGKEKVEETVKEHLEEAIRQHHHRVTQPLRPTRSPPATPSNTSLSPRDSKQLISPSKTSPLPPPKAPHVRHLNFNPVGLHQNLKHLRDFPEFPPLFVGPTPPLPGLGFPHPPHQQLPPSALFGDFLSRSRSNTVPSVDLPRSRTSSFSSLPEHHLGGNGGRMRGAGDNKDLYYCHLCSFVGSTEDQFRNHMDNHFEHQCPHCDYKSRTEGRLKRHIKDFHTEENPDDFTGGRITRREAGKPKFFRCRQCEYVADEKEDYWKHARSHIKDDKCLQCPKCPFVTEYKHHLEYHLRNHFGSKPFKCNKCNYSCVNKSMLNSHMKSHTNVYQYRCQDCTYATKYCHSLKLHLSKYNHQPATVLNTDGSLPVDGSGDFELVSKRGPPRGPRLTKLPDNVPGFERQMDSNLLTMQAGNLGASPNPLNGMAAMMGTLWPNGLTGPPPLIPVSGLAPLNIQLPTERRSSQGQSPDHVEDGHPHQSSAEANGMPSGTCHFCDFESHIPQEMLEHMHKEHSDKQDIIRMLQDEADMREMMEYHSQMRTPPRGSQKHRFDRSLNEVTDFEVMRAKYALENSSNSGSDGSPQNKNSMFSTPEKNNGLMAYYDDSRSCSPNKSPLSDTSPSSLDGRYTSNTLDDAGKSRKSEHPLDLTSKFSGDEDMSPSSAAHKRSWDEDYEEDHNGDINQSAVSSQCEDASGQQRKRSRKGKAYKLDMISIKLQEQYSEHDDNGRDFINGEEAKYDDMPDKVEDKSEQEFVVTPDIKTEPTDSDKDTSQFDTELMTSTPDSKNATLAGKVSLLEKVDSASLFSGSIDRRRLFVQQQRKSPYKKSSVSEGQDSLHGNSMEGSMSEDECVPKSPTEGKGELKQDSGDDWQKYECKHCGIAFRDCIMYTMHMGYHGFQDPFTCNRCGETSKDKIEFFLHIARKAHA